MRFIGILVSVILCIEAMAAPEPLVLVKDGKPVSTIIVGPSQNAKDGAAELQKYIKKISGATLPIGSDATPPSGTLILVGRSKVTDAIPDLKIPSGITKDLREEGFVVRTIGDKLVLAGNDDGIYLGTRYAVVEFLYQLGARFFMPGEFGEVVPTMATVSVPSLDIVQKPDFPIRNYWQHMQGNIPQEDLDWKIHNKMNQHSVDPYGVPGDGSVGGLLPDAAGFKEHPEWFALNRDGTRNPGHPCTTSDEMIKFIAEKIKATARKGSKSVGFAPDDGVPRCWCKRCEAIGNGFDGYGANERDPSTEASVSNEWFYFVNRIMTEVNKEFPDFIISSNGYANRDIPPEVPPDVSFNASKNLVIMFANIGACTIHGYEDKCWQMQRQGQMIRQWSKVCDKVWMYGYNYTMLVSKYTMVPGVHRLRKTIPQLKEWGLMGFNDQDECDYGLWGIPTRYVRAKLEWDSKADVDAILDDYFTKWFGAAAAPMKAYYDALENAFDQTTLHGHEDTILTSIYTHSLMAALDGHINAAETAAKTEVEKSHMQLERALYDYLRSYRAMEDAKAAGKFSDARAQAAELIAGQIELNHLNPYFGYEPYPAYGLEYEHVRMKRLAAMTEGPTGDLVALLPAEANFRLDPHDDGRFERWQDPETDITSWKNIKTTAGWDSQGYQDATGRPYKGVAWYVWDIDVPAVGTQHANAGPTMLHAAAVINEAWAWVNGRYAGHRPYMMAWFRPQNMELDVSKLVKPGEKNRIAIRVLGNFDVWGANGIYERALLYSKRTP